MYEFLIPLLRYTVSLLFGLFLSYQFTGVLTERKYRLSAIVFAILLLICQPVGYSLLGETLCFQLYPVLVHLPLILFLSLCCKKRWLLSAAAVFSAYFCCQPPNWFSKFLVHFLPAGSFAMAMEFVLYTVFAGAFLYILLRFLVAPFYMHDGLTLSNRFLVLYTIFPLTYYLFDYITTVYTDWLYQGSWLAVQFIPMVSCLAFFAAVSLLQRESQIQNQLRHEYDLLSSQINQSKVHLSTLQRLNQDAVTLRHNMRHHLALLKGYLLNHDVPQALQYLDETEKEINAITPVKYCQNEVVNLIFSHYALRAKELSCTWKVDIRLPEQLPLRDTELCVLLSNSLENAIHAVAELPVHERTIIVEIRPYQSRLLIKVENSCSAPVVLRDGLPESSQPGHGYGVRSIAAIVQKHCGNILFTAQDCTFLLQAVIPLQ